MDTGKPTKTFADYLVIAISPALIMVMVHSVCFFLVDVFYRGEAIGGVRWVLFWFVLAVVLIARIGIEQGDGHAMTYGLFLAGVTWIYLSYAQLNAAFGAILLGLVWFTAHKITTNCTLVDDDADASGQGLLQSLRKLPRWLKQASTEDSANDAKSVEAAASQPPVKSRGAATAAKKPPKNRSQIPGVWLLYFGLAALPIFGLGQPLLPADDLAARHRGFVYLFCYLAAAAGLLITTSFLGLRRYLRQRYLAMPGNIAWGWVQYGAMSAVVVLCLALLLPRPGAGEAWNVLRYHVDYRLRQASEYAARFNPHGTGKGRAGDQTSPTGQQPDNTGQPSQTQGPNQNDNSHTGDQENQQAGSAARQGASAGSTGGQQPGHELPSLTPAASSLYPWLKALFYLVAAMVLGWLLYRYRVIVFIALQNVWAAIRNFIVALLALFRPAGAAPVVPALKPAIPPFTRFKNPFLTGADKVWPPEELIVYCYDALQSWALEQEAHGSPQTPRELCRKLAEEMPAAAAALEHLAYLYSHVAYSGAVPGYFNRDHLRLLWDYMSGPRQKPVPV